MTSPLTTRLAVLLTSLAVLFGVCSPAYAQEGDQINVAVLNLEGDGIDQELLETLTSVLRNEAQQYSPYDIVNQSAINLSEIVVVLGCNTDNPTCLKQAAEQLEARVLIYGHVEEVEQAHRVTVEIFNAQSGKVEQRLVRTLVNKRDPVIAFRKQVQKLFETEASEAGTRLQIGSNIEGAKIRVNNTMIGTVPLERKGLPPGRYDVEVYQDGYESWKTTVDLTKGADIRLWAPLQESQKPEPKPVAEASGQEETTAGESSGGEKKMEFEDSSPPPTTAGGGPNWGAWSAIGVGGVALAGSGIMALLMNGTESDLADHDADRHTMDRETYLQERQQIVDTGESYELSHRILLGVGLASVAGGTVWLLIDDEHSTGLAKKRWDVQLSPRGVAASWSW